MIGAEIVRLRRREINACEVDPRRLQLCRREPLPVGRTENRLLEEESAPRHLPQDLRPGREHPIIELRERVEAAERHIARPAAGRLARRRRPVVPHVAELAHGQAVETLREIRVAAALWRLDHLIRQHVVHARHARRAEIADGRELYRGRAIGEHGQEVPSRMPREVDEDVDLILTDLPRDGTGLHALHVAPGRHLRAQLPAHIVLRPVLIAVDIEHAAVVVHEQRIGEKRYDMAAEIRRDIADTQPCMAALTRVMVGPDTNQELAVFLGGREELLLRRIEIVQVEQQIAVLLAQSCLHGLLRDGRAQRTGRLLDAACLLVDLRERARAGAAAPGRQLCRLLRLAQICLRRLDVAEEQRAAPHEEELDARRRRLRRDLWQQGAHGGLVCRVDGSGELLTALLTLSGCLGCLLNLRQRHDFRPLPVGENIA